MTEKMLLQEQCDSFTSKMRSKNHEATKLPCHYPDSLSLSSLSPALPSVSPTFPSPFSTAEKKNHSTIIKLSLRANFSLTEAKLNLTRKFRLFSLYSFIFLHFISCRRKTINGKVVAKSRNNKLNS
jgi:hypothetical protein